MDFNKEIEFIAKHYREGIFNTETVLKRIRRKKVWIYSRIAAASIILAVIGATAAIIINSYNTIDNTETDVTIFIPEQPELIVRSIDFDNAPLPVVIDKINEVYSVEVVNVPLKAGKYRLSLHYEGNAADLINTINEILGTEMKIKE